MWLICNLNEFQIKKYGFNVDLITKLPDMLMSRATTNGKRQLFIYKRRHCSDCHGYFDTLGLDPNKIASMTKEQISDEVKKAYRSKTLALHPDHSKGIVDDVALKLEKVKSARDVLQSPESRHLYMEKGLTSGDECKVTIGNVDYPCDPTLKDAFTMVMTCSKEEIAAAAQEQMGKHKNDERGGSAKFTRSMAKAMGEHAFVALKRDDHLHITNNDLLPITNGSGRASL